MNFNDRHRRVHVPQHRRIPDRHWQQLHHHARQPSERHRGQSALASSRSDCVRARAEPDASISGLRYDSNHGADRHTEPLRRLRRGDRRRSCASDRAHGPSCMTAATTSRPASASSGIRPTMGGRPCGAAYAIERSTSRSPTSCHPLASNPPLRRAAHLRRQHPARQRRRRRRSPAVWRRPRSVRISTGRTCRSWNVNVERQMLTSTSVDDRLLRIEGRPPADSRATSTSP